MASHHHHRGGSSRGGAGNSANPSNDKENVFTGIYESAHFANLFVEFENDTREMAIDVPDHFVATTKTPPKFPPPGGGGQSGTLKSTTSGLFGGSVHAAGSDDGGQSRASSMSMPSNGGHPSYTGSGGTGGPGSPPLPLASRSEHTFFNWIFGKKCTILRVIRLS